MEKTKGISSDKLKELQRELPLKWRQQGIANSNGVTYVAYIDARDLSALLNEVCGAYWKQDFKMVGDRLYCRISILVEGEWIGRESCGSDGTLDPNYFDKIADAIKAKDSKTINSLESKRELAEKGGDSDAFKRAGVMWGINHQSYATDPIKLKTKEYNGKFYPVNDSGQFLKGKALNDYCNAIVEKGGAQ